MKKGIGNPANIIAFVALFFIFVAFLPVIVEAIKSIINLSHDFMGISLIASFIPPVLGFSIMLIPLVYVGR